MVFRNCYQSPWVNLPWPFVELNFGHKVHESGSHQCKYHWPFENNYVSLGLVGISNNEKTSKHTHSMVAYTLRKILSKTCRQLLLKVMDYV